ncbi:MAG: hypothetical protein OEY15_09605 [Myxococcales bacterium]|nr:hypothetical protein [Gemmatimonadota bacterium]MDH5566908.1 hypothetical protein [Myxococcales bacterium]
MLLGLILVAQLAAEWADLIFFEMTRNGRAPGKAVAKPAVSVRKSFG